MPKSLEMEIKCSSSHQINSRVSEKNALIIYIYIYILYYIYYILLYIYIIYKLHKKSHANENSLFVENHDRIPVSHRDITLSFWATRAFYAGC